MVACQDVIDLELTQLARDARWEDVTIHASTNETVYVHGWVESFDDARALWDLVRPVSDRIPVTWSVDVHPDTKGEGVGSGYPDWWPKRRTGSWEE